MCPRRAGPMAPVADEDEYLEKKEAGYCSYARILILECAQKSRKTA
jgi:hypothetical protein